MKDELDEIVTRIQEASRMSAELRNQLHGTMSDHPWCRGKSFEQRKSEALFAVAQAAVPGELRDKLERLRG
jgi:uncharacterized protein (DUF2267 family)